MRFLANENFPHQGIKLLREHGFYVKSIREELPGIKDTEVMRVAQSESLIILTFDKDYGEIIFRHKVVNPPAVIFFRYKGVQPAYAGQTLLKLLADKSFDCVNAFTIIEQYSLRRRSY